MPQVHDEDDSGLLVWVVVPHLMVEGIVKDKYFALLPGQVVVSHSQTRLATTGDLETQVGTQSAVGGPRVGVHMGASLHHAEFDLAPFVGRDLGDCFDKVARRRSLVAVGLVRPPSTVELKLRPVTFVLKALALADVVPLLKNKGGLLLYLRPTRYRYAARAGAL